MLAPGIFVFSLLFLFLVSRIKKIEVLSLYWIFVAFQCLYNVTPWVASQFSIQVLPLLSDHGLIATQLILSATANLCFGLVFLVFYRHTPFAPERPASSRRSSRNFILLTIPVFLITCVLCAKYGWNQFATGAVVGVHGGMYSVTAYAKHFFIGIYLYYLYRFGLNRWGWVLFAENAVVMFIDGSRTTFLPVAFLTCFIFSAQLARGKRVKVYVLAILGVFASVAARSIILPGSSILKKLAVPVTVEGTMGAYTSLQAIFAVEHNANHGHYTYGASYVVDPLALLLPRGELRDEGQLLDSWEHRVYEGIPGKFAPMGGFYYVAETIAAFSFLGPAFITTIYAGFMVWMERNKNRHNLLYLVWTASLGVLFVKATFADVFKIFLVQLTVVLILVGVRRYRVFMGSSAPNSLAGGDRVQAQAS